MATFLNNPILLTDSYKTSHFRQYPPGTETIYSYLESRGGAFNNLVFNGLTPIIEKFFKNTPITMEMVNEAEEFVNAHMGPGCFNRAGWERIVNVHMGYLPVIIKALPEGTVIGPHNVMMTVENTDPELPWVTNYVETLLLQIWYPVSVASLSRKIKGLILEFLEQTGTPEDIDFKLHDFGFRGASSVETAAIGGAAHLINFKGTDNMAALSMIRDIYGDKMVGFSIPAAEHSTITSWGELNEYDAYKNMVDQFGQGVMYAVVSDSYDIQNACDVIWGQMLRAAVENAPATLVVRPDSGHPPTVVLQCVETLANRFGWTVNEKGFKVLNKVRVIQGDGINYDSIYDILDTLAYNGWSADNVAFGMGGALLQQVNRDTAKFAIKASSITRNGKRYDVFKRPAGDLGKSSKAGRFKVIRDEDGTLRSVNVEDSLEPCQMITYYSSRDGGLYSSRVESFEAIRERAKL
jgi:nicotinamide phosphoribosyltransferase